MTEERETGFYDEDGEPLDLDEVIERFLNMYRGIEHKTLKGDTSPETWYTVTSILERNLERIKERKELKEVD